MRFLRSNLCVLLALNAAAAASASSSQPLAAHRLALLIASPGEGEPAMHADLVAMYAALRRRGFAPRELLCLEGDLNRGLVLAFLREASQGVAGWQQGDLLVYYTGHGIVPHAQTPLASFRPGLQFGKGSVAPDEDHLDWDEFFAALRVPSGVRLLLLPDC